MSPLLCARVIHSLACHVGQDNGIHVGDLARYVQASEREVRAAISDLRSDGVGICGHPSRGYFLAATDAELETYCLAFLRKRALHSLKLISVLSKTALPDLLGQLKLKT